LKLTYCNWINQFPRHEPESQEGLKHKHDQGDVQGGQGFARISRRVETPSWRIGCQASRKPPESQEGLKLSRFPVLLMYPRKTQPESQEGLKQKLHAVCGRFLKRRGQNLKKG